MAVTGRYVGQVARARHHKDHNGKDVMPEIADFQSLNEQLRQIWQAIHALDTQTSSGTAAAAIISAYTKTSTSAGQGAYTFDGKITEATTYILRQSNNSDIQILQTGFYLVWFQTNATAGGGSNIKIAYDGATIGRGDPVAGQGISVLGLVNALLPNKNINVTLATAGDRYGDADKSTQLVIYKIV